MKHISLETALLAKEKGFNRLCEGFYDKSGRFDSCSYENWNKGYGETCSCPEQSDLQEWLRDVHKLYIEIEPSKSHEDTVIWFSEVKTLKSFDVSYNTFNVVSKISALCLSYEEALETGLQEALKLIIK